MTTIYCDRSKDVKKRRLLSKLRGVVGKKSVVDICRPSAPSSTVVLQKSVICAFQSVTTFLSGMCGMEEVEIAICLTKITNKRIPPMAYMLDFFCSSFGCPKAEIVTWLSPSAIVVTEAGYKWFEETSIQPFHTYVSKLSVPQSSVAVRLVKYGEGTAMVFHNHTCLYPTVSDDEGFAKDGGSVMKRSPDTSLLASTFLDELLAATTKLKPSLNITQDNYILYRQLVANMPETQRMMCFHDSPDSKKADLLRSYFKPSTNKAKCTIRLRRDDALTTIPPYKLLIEPSCYTDKSIREGLVRMLTKELLH